MNSEDYAILNLENKPNETIGWREGIDVQSQSENVGSIPESSLRFM